MIKEYLLEEIHYYRNVRINCVCVCAYLAWIKKVCSIFLFNKLILLAPDLFSTGDSTHL